MRDKTKIIADGLFGLLAGDALGVPYEFHKAEDIPPMHQIEMIPPNGFDRTYPEVPPGTWSDDGAQALCLLDSLISCGRLDLQDFGNRMVKWVDEGFWTTDGRVFDCGIQTMKSLRAFAEGVSPEKSGFAVPEGKGNGALMRVLPLALWYESSIDDEGHAGHEKKDEDLVNDAHRQALVTHGHICNQVCCALYCLWARYIMQGLQAKEAYEKASVNLSRLYRDHEKDEYLYELEHCLAEGTPAGSGYVVDSIRSARHLLFHYDSYEEVVKGAVAFGNDTDTTAAIAGGLAGLAFGNVPQRWMDILRAKEKVCGALSQLPVFL